MTDAFFIKDNYKELLLSTHLGEAIAAVNELDGIVQELDYRLGEAMEAQEQLEAFEAKKENVESLAQQALSELEGIEHLDGSDIDDIKSRVVYAVLKLDDILKELNK